MRRLIVEADGGARGNPGPAGYGAVVRDASTGEVLAEVAAAIGRTTNNVAEYTGLIEGLRAATRIAAGEPAAVEARVDSQLVAEQMAGRWKIRHHGLVPLAAQARELAKRFARIDYTWVPRSRNAHADRLANEAMDAAAEGRPWSRRTGVDGAAGAAGTVADTPAGTMAAPAAGGESGAAPSWAPSWAPAWAPAWVPSPQTPLGPAERVPTTTLLLRHGQTPLSVERRFAGVGDTPLTEVGREQARAAARRLAARGGIDAIVSSPLSRARDTAAAAAELLDVRVRVEEDLREADFGAWEGLSFGEAQQGWPEQMTAWLRDPQESPPGGESLAAVDRRVTAALERILADHPRQVVLVVSHVTPIKTLVRHALQAGPGVLFRMHLDVACLCEVQWYADGPAVVRSLNDTGHLV